MLLLLLGWRALARRHTSMIRMLARDSLVRRNDDIIALQVSRSQPAIVTIIHDGLDRSRRAMVLDLLLPVRDDR